MRPSLPQALLLPLKGVVVVARNRDREIIKRRHRYAELPDFKSLTEEAKAALPGTIAAYQRYLAPGPVDDITIRVTVLLSHYFVPDIPEAAQAAIMVDWVDALHEFPYWAVKKACDNWRNWETKKPTPAHIRTMCMDAVRDDRETLDRLQRLNVSKAKAGKETSEGKSVTAAEVDKILEKFGHRQTERLPTPEQMATRNMDSDEIRAYWTKRMAEPEAKEPAACEPEKPSKPHDQLNTHGH